MAPSTFQTISDELLEYAEAALTAFRKRGYTVAREQAELGFPYTPAMLCKRDRTTIIVDVVASISATRVASWVAYTKSSGKDTRFAICLPDSVARHSAAEDLLRTQGVGLYSAGPTALTEIIAPSDLALAVPSPASWRSTNKAQASLRFGLRSVPALALARRLRRRLSGSRERIAALLKGRMSQRTNSNLI